MLWAAASQTSFRLCSLQSHVELCDRLNPCVYLENSRNSTVVLEARECVRIRSVHVGILEVLVAAREWPACGAWEDARLSEETIGLRRGAKMAVLSIAETRQL